MSNVGAKLQLMLAEQTVVKIFLKIKWILLAFGFLLNLINFKPSTVLEQFTPIT